VTQFYAKIDTSGNGNGNGSGPLTAASPASRCVCWLVFQLPQFLIKQLLGSSTTYNI
jgi:hypothetical protein